MARHAAAPLQTRAENGIADPLGDVEDRAEFLRLLGRQPFVVDAGQAVGMDVALEHLHVMDVVGQHHAAARRIHDVVVELLRQVLPQVQGVVIKRLALFPEVVRADDRRVAAGVAAAEPALLDDRNVPHAVLGRHVIGGGEAMPAAAHDHGIVRRSWFRMPPLFGPARVAGKALADQLGEGESQGVMAPGGSAAMSGLRPPRSSTGATSTAPRCDTAGLGSAQSDPVSSPCRPTSSLSGSSAPPSARPAWVHRPGVGPHEGSPCCPR